MTTTPDNQQPHKELDEILQKYIDPTYSAVDRDKYIVEAKQRLNALIENKVREALDTERKVTLGLSNTSKIDRALALSEKHGYEKRMKDEKRAKELKIELLKDLADCGEIHHQVFDYRLAQLQDNQAKEGV